MTTLGTTRAIQRSIERGGFVRRATSRLDQRGSHKEWLHFSITTPEVDVFINFSLADDTRAGVEPRAEIARLTCAVRTSTWDGDIDAFHSDEVRAKSGDLSLQFGANYVHCADGSYRVVVRLRKRPVAIDLTLVPKTIASQVNNIALNDAPPMHWFVVPKLLASGEVSCGNQRFELENIPAYHDHNWGYFRWGQDFSWIWGYGQGSRADSPWAFAFDRLSNRARTTDFLRGLLLWKDARHFRLFGGSELEIHTEGVLRSEVLRLPRLMALTRPREALEVPAKLRGRAESRGDVLEFEFQSRNMCQLIAPNDDDLGVTTVSEVAGDLRMLGVVSGEPIDVEGRGMFEFLGE